MRFKISFYGDYVNPDDRWPHRKHITTVEVSATKMTNKWMEKHYGKDWKQSHAAMYYCTETSRKKHGIVWICENVSYYSGSTYYDITDDCRKTAKEPIPEYGVYKEVRVSEVHNRRYY